VNLQFVDGSDISFGVRAPVHLIVDLEEAARLL
jgi:hypothetical protein